MKVAAKQGFFSGKWLPAIHDRQKSRQPATAGHTKLEKTIRAMARDDDVKIVDTSHIATSPLARTPGLTDLQRLIDQA